MTAKTIRSIINNVEIETTINEESYLAILEQAVNRVRAAKGDGFDLQSPEGICEVEEAWMCVFTASIHAALEEHHPEVLAKARKFVH